MAADHYDFVMHDVIQRWQDKQRKGMEERLKTGEVLLKMDFSAIMAMVQRLWTSEDSRHHRGMEGSGRECAF